MLCGPQGFLTFLPLVETEEALGHTPAQSVAASGASSPPQGREVWMGGEGGVPQLQPEGPLLLPVWSIPSTRGLDPVQ